jgi:hypothetical protein
MLAVTEFTTLDDEHESIIVALPSFAAAWQSPSGYYLPISARFGHLNNRPVATCLHASFHTIMSESGASAERQFKILLLRSPAEKGEDKYESVFRESEYEGINVPVLETVNVNIEEVKNLMREGPQGVGVDGVIMTSGRSSSIWKEFAEELAEEVSSSKDATRIAETSG